MSKSTVGIPQNNLLPVSHADYIAQARHRFNVRIAWVALGLAAMVTFGMFMSYDPRPDWLLSASAAANVGIILWGIYRLYEMRLLLSPMAAVLIGPGWIIQYSWGNLWARVAGEARMASNPGSLNYYPLAGLLSTIGLLIFCWVVFGLLKRYSQYYRIRYEDLSWRPWQVLFTSLVSGGVLIYLSSKYPFISGYFQNVEGQFDKALSASQYYFVTLATLAGVSVSVKSRMLISRLMGWSGIVIPLLIAVGLRSRTFMLLTVITIGICWITLRPQSVRQVLAFGLVGLLAVYALGSVVKQANISGDITSISGNLEAVAAANWDTLREVNTASGAMDVQYRLAGFELPAAILMSLDRGALPLYGQGMVGGITSALPSMIRPPGLHSERLAIYRGFYGRGLYYGDSIGVPLSSGLADWGVLFGPLIYAIMGLYGVLAWRFVQVSPSLFVAYLIVGASPGDLFWENALYTPRAIAFIWVFLLVLGKLVLPAWTPSSGPEAS